MLAESSQQINKLCMGGCCSVYPRSSHKFGKQIARKLQDVQDQWRHGDFKTVAIRAPLPSVTIQPNDPTVGLEFTFNEVWSSLQDEQVGIIGLYGQGGVGKTALLKQINNRFHDTAHDYHVIWVVVSRNMQMEKLQEEIRKGIGFSDEAWKNKRLDEKAADIFSILRKKKFLLLLDDIWEFIDLTKVGVPLPTQVNESKIIFTTRLNDVCLKMRAHKIRVECLQQPEALKLFEENVGAITLNSHPEIRELAEAVAGECAGLPLALIVIGRAMSSMTEPEQWKRAIKVLRQAPASAFPEVEKDMYRKLKFSYDALLDDRIRSCFLYCSLYPEDYFIRKDELVYYWIGEGLLDKHTDFSSARNEVYYILRLLTNACLLEDGNKSVKMHDVIRDMALWIANESETEKFLVQSSAMLKEQPVDENWEKVRRVSLMENQIENLTEIVPCPNLQTLFLGSNQLKVINNDFFNSMPMLRTLDLSYNRKLVEFPAGIAKLVSLEHLDMSCTQISELPVELKALEKLKYLNLEGTTSLKMIPQQLISSFSKLQVLKMMLCGCEWSVEQIEHLKDLEILTITFHNASMLERALRSYKFQTCNVEAITLHDFKGSRSLNIMSLAKLQHLQYLELFGCDDLEEVKMEREEIASAECFKRLETVMIHSCSKLRDVSWAIFAQHLGELVISGCPNLEEIISKEKLDEVGVPMETSNWFSNLFLLSLLEMSKLETIYRDVLPFPCLHEIYIRKCSMLKQLPLNSDSAKGRKIVIRGQEDWWKDLEWKDEATRTFFLPSFEPLPY